MASVATNLMLALHQRCIAMPFSSYTVDPGRLYVGRDEMEDGGCGEEHVTALGCAGFAGIELVSAVILSISVAILAQYPSSRTYAMSRELVDAL